MGLLLLFCSLLSIVWSSTLTSCGGHDDCRRDWDCDAECIKGSCVPANSVPASKLPTYEGLVLTKCQVTTGACVECMTVSDCGWLKQLLNDRGATNVTVSCEENAYACSPSSLMPFSCISSECTSDAGCMRDWACGSKCQDHHRNCIYGGDDCTANTSAPFCDSGWCVGCKTSKQCPAYYTCSFHHCSLSLFEAKWILIGALFAVIFLVFVIVFIVRSRKYLWKKARKQSLENLLDGY